MIWPLALPGIAAGSIFTFSLTLGDYVTARPGRRQQPRVHRQRHLRVPGRRQNLPFAAAFACVPVAIVVVYLMLMKRIGAFEAL